MTNRRTDEQILNISEHASEETFQIQIQIQIQYILFIKLQSGIYHQRHQ